MKNYQFTTNSNANYVLVTIEYVSSYNVTFSDLSLDYYETDNSTLYDQTTYTTIDGDNVVKNYEYESDALMKLDYISLVNGTFTLTQDFVYSNDTTRINEIVYNLNDGQSTVAYKYVYTYDSLNNITSVKYYEGTSLVTYEHYEYDEMNQLVVEDVRDYSVSSTTLTDTNYTKYFYYDLKGNITDIKTFLYGQNDVTNPVIPSFYQRNFGTYDAIMYYNGSKDYRDIYNLNVGQSPSLTFTYEDVMWGSGIMGMTTSYQGGNLDTSTPGYYYQTYRATDGNWYDVEFKIIFKVGNPVSGPTPPQEHIRYNYSTKWLDQLTGTEEVFYDASGNEDYVIAEQEFTYDTQGNPTSITNFYYDDNDSQTDNVWHHADLEFDGRQLVKITIYDDLSETIVIDTITYTYNDQGYRTSKTVDGVTTEYHLQGDKVVFETDGTYGIMYSYDQDGTIISFNYDSNINDTTAGNEYYYIRNQQGDITKIVDEDGNVIVEYQYDAWGNIVSTSDTSGINLSIINPYRYRGYRFDEEISMYYLNSRFYDANIGRFINADDLVGSRGTILGTNMFSYTTNNPVMNYDPSGYFGLTLTLGGALAGAIASAILTAVVIVAVVVVVAVIAYTLVEAIEQEIEENKEDDKNREYLVYHLIDDTGTVQYVGRTSQRNLSSTTSRHKNNPFRTDLTLVVAYQNLSYEEARGLEQSEMLAYHTLNAMNKANNQINGVGDNNKNKAIYFEAAAKYLWNQISNELYNIFD